MRDKRRKSVRSNKRRRKRLRGELRSIFYSTEGMGLWHWTERGLRRVLPSPLYFARGCLLISVAVVIGLIVLVKSPWLWLIVAVFVLIALMIKTMSDMYKDMKRERRRFRAIIKKERARAKAKVEEEHEKVTKVIEAFETLTQELPLMKYPCPLMWQTQQRMAEMNAPQNLELQLVYNNNLNNMNFFGNVDMNGGNIYGDNAVHNETHHHYGSEQETRVNMEGGLSPYVALLRKMMAPLRESGNWGTILCPYKAAVIEGVLPKWPHKFFCSQMGVQVPSSSYSEWMKDGRHAEDDLEPYSEEFRKLKHEIDNSK